MMTQEQVKKALIDRFTEYQSDNNVIIKSWLADVETKEIRGDVAIKTVPTGRITYTIHVTRKANSESE